MNRNQRCSCGSGRRFKHCCGRNLTAAATPERARQMIRQGQFKQAAELLHESLNNDPSDAGLRELLGYALLQDGQPEAARDALEPLVRQKPGQPGGWFNLGLSCHRSGDRDSAEKAYRRAWTLAPGNPMVAVSLGALLRQAGQVPAAITILEQVNERSGDGFDLDLELGACLNLAGREADAETPLRSALTAQPDEPRANLQLGLCLFRTRRAGEALDCFRRSAQANPGDALALVYLGAALQRVGRYADAHDALQNALQRDPRHARALAALARLEKDLGLVTEAIGHYREALALNAGNLQVRSNLLMAMNYSDQLDEVEIAQAHREFGQLLEAASPRETIADRKPGPLRIGLVSADLREHSVAYFLRPVLRELSDLPPAVIAFSNSADRDGVTTELIALCDDWLDIHALDDDHAASAVASRGIDVLIDLSGHSAGNRPGLFARRPAPVQASWLGYPNTTGLSCIDYRITDRSTDPLDQGPTNPGHTESCLYLTPRFSCYSPPAEAPEVAPPPAPRTGAVTFGSFNNLAKLSPAVIACWSAILEAVPDARLCLKSRALTDEAIADQVRGRFNHHGVDPKRIEVLGRDEDKRAHLARYAELDLALDPFPYNGTTTSCEALWMGVPVLALRGGVHRSRVTAGLLDDLGLPELIAASPADYVDRAVALSSNLPLLAQWRSQMRQRMASSPVMDASGFARSFWAALQQIAPAD